MHPTLEAAVQSLFFFFLIKIILWSRNLRSFPWHEEANETVFIDGIGKLVSVLILVTLSTWMLEMINFSS